MSLKGKYVIAINAGSSSFKVQIISSETEETLLGVVAERIGSQGTTCTFKVMPGTDKETVEKFEVQYKDHSQGIRDVMQRILDKNILPNFDNILATGHRVLMGGSKYAQVQLDADVKKVIKDYFPLSPLHNPANLACIEVMEELLPSVPAVAIFDTGFHKTMPEYAYTYPIPQEYVTKYGLRRYGFHGISHKFVSEQAAIFLAKENGFTGICCHLGNGCSITAIKDGKCIDTSMGLTPLEGLVMGTRCGDIDPSVALFLMENEGFSSEEMSDILNKKSGLLAICGSNDMRDIIQMQAEGQEKAFLATEIFTYRVKKYIGSYMAVLGCTPDAILFTGGIGENDDAVRKDVCTSLKHFGIDLDEKENAIRSSKIRVITTKNSRIPVLVVPTNEELEIMRSTLVLLGYK